ncbi:MAG: hypothetical protein MUO97_07695 [Dehalococcoidia bacterium]|nr:hypothetical protein [Dehalococcoidia bacterium]
MSAISIGVIVFLGLVVVWLLLSMRVKRWYKVYLANNDVILACRTWRERWWSGGKFMQFREDSGRLITFPSDAHWILMWEQIPDNEVELVRQQIRDDKARRASLEDRMNDFSDRLDRVERHG